MSGCETVAVDCLTSLLTILPTDPGAQEKSRHFTLGGLLLLLGLGGALGGYGSYLVGDRVVGKEGAPRSVETGKAYQEIWIGVVGAIATFFILSAATDLGKDASASGGATIFSIAVGIGYASRRLLRVISTTLANRIDTLGAEIDEAKDGVAKARRIADIEAGIAEGAPATRRAEATRLLKENYRKDPDDFWTARRLSNVLCAAKDYRGAEKIVEAFLASQSSKITDAERGLMHYIRACHIAREDQSRLEEVQKHLSDAFTLNPVLKDAASDDEDFEGLSEQAWFKALIGDGAD